MAFGRKKKQAEESVDEPAVTEQAAAPELPPVPKTTGPYDLDDVEDEQPRLDLGGLRVPVPEGVELRVDVSPEGQVVSAVLVDGPSQMQLNAFAAPRREGIWADVRAEIADALRPEGGQPQEADGPYGTELRARIPAGQPGQTTPARFVGVDGPRWFLRGLLTGPAATDASQDTLLLRAFGGVVVVRGDQAMPPRDALPLRLPKEAEGTPDEPAGDRFTGDDLNPFERGPEITETR